ncbi:DUF6432 family protein [Halocatena halophila]|uniref:DUF6432 family protein n=1 Tax=Halocatena halophila TaxID=2814576 RepID=UPI002ED68D6D
MRANEEYRNRDATEVSILDALVERSAEGMTILELRTRVGVEIDVLETALASLNDDGLLETSRTDGQLLLRPADRVIPETATDDPGEPTLIERLRDRLFGDR